MKFERCLDSESMFSDVFYAIISGLIVSWKNVFMYRCNSLASVHVSGKLNLQRKSMGFN